MMSRLIGHSQHPPRLRRRGASGGAQAGRRNARRCDCAKGGLCCQLMVHAAARITHHPSPALDAKSSRGARSSRNGQSSSH
jgi:hypothetical protein